NLPLPRRFLKVALRRSERVSNTVASVLEVGGGTGLPSRVSGPASRSPPPIAASGQGRTPRQRGATEDRDELVVHDRTIPASAGSTPHRRTERPRGHASNVSSSFPATASASSAGRRVPSRPVT